MQTLKNKVIQLALAVILISSFALGTTYADSHPCHPELDNPPGAALTQQQVAACQACNIKNPSDAQLNHCLSKNPIIDDLRTIAQVLSAGVGVVIVGVIIWGGIQYTLAGNNANAVSSAKGHITNALIALVTFFFIVAFLNWIIPGGLAINL